MIYDIKNIREILQKYKVHQVYDSMEVNRSHMSKVDIFVKYKIDNQKYIMCWCIVEFFKIYWLANVLEIPGKRRIIFIFL